jgi:hypothetical protein
LALALLGACGDPDADGDQPTTQVGNPANVDAGIVDTGVVTMPPVVADAGSTLGFDAGTTPYDAGPVIAQFDAGGMTGPQPEAGASDAGNVLADAGPKSDAGGGDGGACALSYENFGKQFMTTYCISCHSGTAAKRMVQLDTLAGVVKNKTAVKRLAVTNTTMPEGTLKPAAADRQKLGQWLDCGPL